MPEVSVIIPVYNSEKYVEKCYYLKCKDYVIVVGYI